MGETTEAPSAAEVIQSSLLEIRQRVAKQVSRDYVLDLLNASYDYIDETGIKYIGWKEYSEIVSNIPSRYKIPSVLKSLLLLLVGDQRTHLLPVKTWIDYLQGYIDLFQTYLDLLTYSNESYVTDEELERYIYDLIPSLKALDRLSESFHPFYTFSAVRRFLFFLDPYQLNKISIHKLVHSEVMEEFLALNRVMQLENEIGAQQVMNKLSSNWFNATNASYIYQTFLRLDVDKNGTLNIGELLNFTGNPLEKPSLHLTSKAVRRIFEISTRQNSKEMDYKAFVDFVLIMENKESERSKNFFWNALNIDSIEEGGTGRITRHVIEYFYKDIAVGLVHAGCDAPLTQNVVTEIHDILGCSVASGIRYEDVMSSSQGHTVMLMLLDINAFWAYDNRESLIPNEDEATN